MVTDTIADVLTRIRNGQRAKFKSVTIPASRMTGYVLDVLKEEGFIEGVEKTEDGFGKYEVGLRYYSSGEPVISVAQRVSKSGRRKYFSNGDVPRVFSGLGISIVSTSQGVMSDREARKRKIGGEVLALIG